MDKYGVPKKVNRHVLKALYFISECGFDNADFTDICERVQITMKNNVPVKDLPSVVRKSLENMTQLGVITKSGSRFYIRNPDPSIPYSNYNAQRVFRLNNRPSDGSKLDPNLRRRHDSDDSMSGNEIEKTRKRFRSNRPLSRKGIRVILPKAKMSTKKIKPNEDVDESGCPYEQRRNEPECDKNEIPNPFCIDMVFTSSNYAFPELSEDEEDFATKIIQVDDKYERNSEECEEEYNLEDPTVLPTTEPASEETVTPQQVDGNSQKDAECSNDPQSVDLEVKKEI